MSELIFKVSELIFKIREIYYIVDKGYKFTFEFLLRRLNIREIAFMS